MPVILNEVKQAEFIIKSGEIGAKPSSTLFLLGKYYRQKEELSKEQTFEGLNNFMNQHYKNYNPALWEDIIEDISRKSNKYPLKEIEFIGITQSEINKIAELKNIKYEKLLFTALCYAKLHNIASENNNGWANMTIKELFMISRVTVKHSADKFLYLNDLEKTGCISFSNKNDNLNIKVNIIDTSTNPILEITDFRELGYEYLHYIGDGKFIRCSECGRLVRKVSQKDFSTKYCAQCARQIKNQQNKSYYKSKI